MHHFVLFYIETSRFNEIDEFNTKKNFQHPLSEEKYPHPFPHFPDLLPGMIINRLCDFCDIDMYAIIRLVNCVMMGGPCVMMGCPWHVCLPLISRLRITMIHTVSLT